MDIIDQTIDTYIIDNNLKSEFFLSDEKKHYDEKIAPKLETMIAGGKKVHVPFDKRIWDECIRLSWENKQWAIKAIHSEDFKKSCGITQESAHKYLTKSIDDLAIDYYHYWYLRSHLRVNVYGSPRPIDEEWATRWEIISGKKIKECDFFV